MIPLIKLKCDYCKKYFNRELSEHNHTLKRYNSKHFFCKRKCLHKFRTTSIKFQCHLCKKTLKRIPAEIKSSKTKCFFCDHSCSATYYNKLRKKSRRSKIEIKFYNLLVKEFPNLNIIPNDRTILNGLEVDVSIPSLNLAIEWNGKIHFVPIYGSEKLSKIQQNDAKKLKIASEKDINLIVIPDLVSNDKILQEAFNDCKKIINNLM